MNAENPSGTVRITALVLASVADVYCALTEERPYKKAEQPERVWKSFTGWRVENWIRKQSSLLKRRQEKG